ncbi:NADH dehydrogenase 1 alpha subcomplex subunit [Parastagonospora nodorum]|nr:NADH dehydrogenase 1 alpha subcomplex subunit [Parastagonospora nodorum]KAH4054771.1 NADH dehydrogenase 1 alpha subcomplex subunit [Parastagonospora nodorum]KAH4066427.1 NADH dehydrogenase 1 alpha subcomplex subunit [Parastagonospora nodorum]KAH4089508.1 NADH dehydrogenase 1 alpha subcomplex subunit [Parastagonospora nodorum]KAH4109100.1 NADH dehydrogenase 1 alpha subcomplex subunit [Parastagonospora nodorum]
MPKAPGPILRAWYEWRMKRFLWRKKWLVGFDLQGNTFWEFKDQLHALRNRRIAKYSRDTHYGDVNVSPSWMQWLRHTRFDPPSIAEQQQEIRRQERMKMLAAQADARWASKPSALDAPDKQQPMQMLQSRDPDSGVTQMNVDQERRDELEPPRTVEEQEAKPQSVVEDPEPQQMPRDPPAPPASDAPTAPRKKPKKEHKDSPWKQAETAKDWQPQGWTPAPRR